MNITSNALAWFKTRGISALTLAALGVESGTATIGGQICEVIAFPYVKGDKVVNIKSRAFPEKAFFQKNGGEQRFWNLDSVLKAAPTTVYVVEGEIDALSLVEAGIEPSEVLSVPNGAPVSASDAPENQQRYAYVDSALREGLSGTKRFVLLTDGDGPGAALRQDLVRLLGAARCCFVEWPDGLKDANDILIAKGAGGLRRFVLDTVKPWPVVGLYRLSELPNPPPLEIWYPGFPEWEKKLAFASRTLSVVTGQPGAGKTSLSMQLLFQMCQTYGLKVAVASFETVPKPYQRRNIRQFMFRKPENQLSERQLMEADRWIEDHILWIVHPNRKPSLQWVLEVAETAIIRHRARIIQIDPWNRLESTRPQHLHETDWIGQCLDEVIDFAREMNVHFQILAHPAKAQSPDQRRRPPQLEDIASSKHWDNKTDLGLCVYRPSHFEDGERKTDASLYVLKARHEELGYPCKLDIEYDLAQCRYVSTEYRTRMEAM